MFLAGIASTPDWNPSRFADTSPLAGHPPAPGGRVAVEQGRLLVQALDAMVAEIDAEAAAAETANEPEPAGHVSAETSADEPATVTESPIPVRTGRATALVHIAEHYLATGGSGAKPLTSSEAYQVFVHVNANDAGPDNRINGAHTCRARRSGC